MSEKNLTQLLEQLHTELDSTEAVDDQERELLHDLSADIKELLERSRDADESLLERLQESIDRFGEQHPALTTVLSHLMTALNNAGI